MLLTANVTDRAFADHAELRKQQLIRDYDGHRPACLDGYTKEEVGVVGRWCWLGI